MLTNETYAEHSVLLDRIVWRFVRKYGGDWEELRADANLFLVRAADEAAPDSYRYDPAKGTFESHVGACVYFGLLEEHRKKAARLHKTGPVMGGEAIDFVAAKTRNPNWLRDLMEELTEDGKTVISLVLEAPAELAQAIADKGGSPRNVRSSVKQWLLSQGWGTERVTKVWSEVDGVLGS